MAPGGELALEIDVANRGFAAPYNERPVYVVLSGAGTRQVVRLEAVDPRRWVGGEVSKISVRLRVPASLAPGSYRVALWLPDAASRLKDDPRYAIRLANEGVWDAATGDNVLTETLRVDASAPGTVDPAATTFVEIR